MSLSVEIKDDHIVINGVVYSNVIFEQLSLVTPRDRAIRIQENIDGIVCVRSKQVPLDFWNES